MNPNTPQYWDRYWTTVAADRPIIKSIARAFMDQIGEEGVSVIDFGCGDGQLDWVLEQQLNLNISCVDYSRVALDRAKERGLNVMLSDARDLSVFGKYDYVITSNLVEHLIDIPDFEQIANKRVIHIISTKKRDSHIRIYTEDELKTMFDEVFTIYVPEWNENQIVAVSRCEQ